MKRNNEETSRVEDTTVLGVLIDAKLTWKNHISLVKSKKCCAIMYRARFMSDKSCVLILYNSFFLPYIMYCIEIRSNKYVTNVNCLVLLQTRLYGYFLVLY